MNEKVLEEMKKKDPLFAKLFKNIKAGDFKTKKDERIHQAIKRKESKCW